MKHREQDSVTSEAGYRKSILTERWRKEQTQIESSDLSAVTGLNSQELEDKSLGEKNYKGEEE